MESKLIGRKTEVLIGPDLPTVIIGERINPTGKKKLAEALRAGDMDYVRQLALTQVEQGAQVIDVNVGTTGVVEEVVLPRAVEMVADATGLPVCIDSPDEKALPAALKICGGKPLINSVNGEEASLARVLPLVKEFDASVIGLTMDDDGIPDTAEGRLRVAEKIVERAAKLGIGPERILVDCLALTVGADHRAALTTLTAIRLVREKLGVNLALGASNVSHGLPDRETVNGYFIAMAIAAGVNCPIVDPGKARESVVVADLLTGRDEWSQNYLAHYRAAHPES
ncbi:MAG: pterin-binding protein [Chloroflexi bacterium]|nr:pterin-binding protein [Chloroflexota bacterium]